MNRPDPEPRQKRILKILAEVEECVAQGRQPDLERYFVRFPELEEDLRGQFRRMGLLADPYRDAGQYHQDRPPWESPAVQEADPASPQAPPEPHSYQGRMLIENLFRPVVQGDRRPLKRRSRTLLTLALAFLAGWAILVILEEFSRGPSLEPSARSRMEGMAALLVLAAQWPGARDDFLQEGVNEADRSIRAEDDRWEFRLLRFFFLQGLRRGEEAARDLDSLPAFVGRQIQFLDTPVEGMGTSSRKAATLVALGEVLEGKVERAKEILGGQAVQEDDLLDAMARGAVEPDWRLESSRKLIQSENLYVRLLGGAWGIGAGDSSAREALRKIPIDSLAVARVLVELGEEDLFLEKGHPRRVELAPLRIQVLRRKGKTARALQLGETLLAEYPNSFELRLALARLLRERGELERAAAHLRIATAQRSSSGEPMREWLLLAPGFAERPDLITPCADLFLRRMSDQMREFLDEPARSGAGAGNRGVAERFLVAAGFGFPREDEDRKRALEALSRAAGLKPEDAALQFLLARSLFAVGRWSEAAERFRAAGEAADPLDRKTILAWRAASLRRAGKIEEAEAAERILQEKRASPLARSLEKTLDTLGGPGKAASRQFLKKALTSHPELEEGLVQLARKTTGTGLPGGDPRKTLEILRDRIELKRSGSPLLQEYARALEWTGGWERAAEVYSELAAREPEWPGSRARGAWALAIAGEWDQAESLLASGGETDRNPGVEELLVGAFLSAGREDFDLVEVRLGQAVEEEPTDLRCWFLRGYFRRIQGREEASNRDWNEVLRIVEATATGRLEAGGKGGSSGDALEIEANPLLVALVHAGRGDLEAARCEAAEGPPRGRTLPGAFFLVAARCAISDLAGARAAASAYRDRRFPGFSWQALDPWAGKLFRGEN